MFFLAQLVAPPLQPGPVRLPNKAPQERPAAPERVFDLPPESQTQPPNETDSGTTDIWRPDIKGTTPYTDQELQIILKDCGKPEVNATLNACAAALTARLIQDGYINSRVYTLSTPEPGALEVVLGTIAELRITSEDEALQQQVKQQLTPLIGTVLHIPTLEKSLVKVRKRGAGQIKGGMGRLGSDPTKAVVRRRRISIPFCAMTDMFVTLVRI